jgi:endonuclease/exonuclease/phosphatase (EEP) superfamily protein YafD
VAARLLLWAPIALGVGWVSIRLLGLERGFLLVALIAYTPYAALGTILVLAITLLLRRWIAVAAAVCVLAGFGIALIPRGISNGDETAEAGPGLTLMTANLMLGEADPESVVELVRDEGVDVLSVQELTPETVDGLRRAQLDRLLPESELIPAEGSAGGGIYSRLPLRRLPDLEPLPGAFAIPRGLIRVPGASEVEVLSPHARPPTADGVDAWRADLERLPPAAADSRPRLLLGDFNATLDHAELRELLSSGYTDAADVTGTGFTPTWPADGLPPPVAIDHVLADDRVEVLDASVRELPGSDHRAVIAEVALPVRE